MPVPGRIAAILAVAGGILGAGALFSCDDLPITSVTFRVDDPWTFAQPAMPLFIEVRGNPGTADAGAEMVVAAMREAISWHGNPRLTADPALAGTPSTRVVMTFNPVSAGGAEANCAGRIDGGEADADGAVRLLATFCADARPLANVEGRLRRPGAGDERLRALLKQVTLDMFRGERHP